MDATNPHSHRILNAPKCKSLTQDASTRIEGQGLRMRLVNVAACACALLVSSCAGVKVVALNPDLSEDKGKPQGFLYYPPKPYLLVAEAPLDPTPAGSATSPAFRGDADAAAPAKQNKKGAKADTPNAFTPKKGGDSDDDSNKSSTTSPAPTSDTSFGLATKQYQIKLIYLPDYEHPRAIQKTGLIGTSEVKPELVDGWMLTGIDAASDSKTSEIIGSLASLVTGGGGGSGSGGKGSSGKGDSGGDAEAKLGGDQLTLWKSLFPRQKPPVLPPGLYEISFSAGKFVGISPVVYFCHDGSQNNPCS
jgi:hypothetical protein